MTKKLPIFILMAATLLFGIPFGGYAAPPETKASIKEGNLNAPVATGFGQPGRKRWRQNGRWVWGYSNYGQFRRTQVGNRRYRYRVYPEYYYVGPVRRVRYVRFYYYY